MIKVTFDTNTFDKAVRPQVYAKDPNHGRFLIIHEAIKDGRIAAFVCDAIVTLEGIKIDDRVFGSTTITSRPRRRVPKRSASTCAQSSRFDHHCIPNRRSGLAPPSP
jgi:hypothetical protein